MSIIDFLRILRLPVGRQLLVINQITTLAQARQLTSVVDKCEASRARLAERLKLEARYAAQRAAGKTRVDAGPLDALLDDACAAIHDVCQTQSRRSSSPAKARHAELLLTICFPAGLAPVVSASYEQQFAQLTRIAAALSEAEPQAALAALALAEEADTITANLAAYEQAIAQLANLVTDKDLRAIRDATHADLCAIVAMILGQFHSHEDPDHAAARAELLAPLRTQEAILTASRRARKPITDLDPDTGEERPVVEPIAEEP
jgi:hypothetical protein